MGSSPLTRGALRDDGVNKPCPRLIPAHAGSTSVPLTASMSSRAHPRSRGEHSVSLVRLRACRGSSPLTRGAPRHPGARARFCVAHPRSRGEHKNYLLLAGLALGSSPLTRGALTGGVKLLQTVGLIPAHAGSTISDVVWATITWAHPRSRGEHSYFRSSPLAQKGSSPLTRGAPFRRCRRELSRGLIPAHAGSTWRESTSPGPARAHPRSRGEHVHHGVRQAQGPGSSPLTRGAHGRGA